MRALLGAACADDLVVTPTYVPDLAHACLEWARMLLARRESADPERARELLARALDTARELALANIERQAAELLASSIG